MADKLIRVDFSKLDYEVHDNRPRGRPEDLGYRHRRTDRMAFLLEGYARVSQRGVPHVVVVRGETTYSVCWFSRGGFWRVFFPYPSWGAEQTKLDFYNDNEVVQYFDAK